MSKRHKDSHEKVCGKQKKIVLHCFILSSCNVTAVMPLGCNYCCKSFSIIFIVTLIIPTTIKKFSLPVIYISIICVGYGKTYTQPYQITGGEKAFEPKVGVTWSWEANIKVTKK